MKVRIVRGWFFALFAVSGFAGLVYESIWSHYLRLFLGHAAYAQTLVLVILMGGMALGAWICSRLTGHWRNLLLAYALAEAVIGIFAIAFHAVFVAATEFAYDVAMPALGDPLAVSAFQWVLSAILILPQSVLLGATFPLMSAGIIRAFPERSGGTIAMLYFTNSLGAALGVLLSGFYLVGAVGLPGTVLTAGLVNIALALVVWLLAKDLPQPIPAPARRAAAGNGADRRGYRLMLAISLLTGAASFMYEIGWIRMLSMVLGSSTHAFELMLSAFILGLAFGGLWIKRRVDTIPAPETLLGVVQTVMGLLALATLLVYGRTFELMRMLMDTLARTEYGYAAFNFGSHLIALLVMFPAAFCAGMTLPLITHVLLRRGHGERAIGAVYAANTVGAIVGTGAAVHIAMPLLGLKGLIMLGAGIDIALGLALLWRVAGASLAPRLAGVAGAAALGATFAWVELDTLKMASGVYRAGRLIEAGAADIRFHRDGKTATVSLLHSADKLSVTTNGKSDAMIGIAPQAPPSDDEPTMIMAAALPLAVHPTARTAAVIGIGSGISSHVLLTADTLRSVDTIEIEPAMVEAARGFGPRNRLVFDDSRSRIHIEDAKTFFSVQRKRYDIIVSMPSNPWVSGVAGLFTDEFYRRIRRHLESGGVLVQWLQLYEISPALVASVMKAVAQNFSHFDIYASDDGNLIVIARDGAPVPLPSETAFRQRGLAAELVRLQIRGAADMDVFRLGHRHTLQPYFSRFAIAANSDYFPVLDQSAAKARFMGARADDIVALGRTSLPADEFLGGAPRRATALPSLPWLTRSQSGYAAQQGLAYLLEGDQGQLERVPLVVRSDFQLVRLAFAECSSQGPSISVEQLFTVAGALLPDLAKEQSRAVWQRLRAPCIRLREPQANWVALFAAIDGRDSAAMARVAEALLGKSDAPHRDYLLAAAILGRLSNGEPEAAVLLWRRFASTVASDRRNVLPDLLQGHLFAHAEDGLARVAH